MEKWATGVNVRIKLETVPNQTVLKATVWIASQLMLIFCWLIKFPTDSDQYYLVHHHMPFARWTEDSDQLQLDVHCVRSSLRCFLKWFAGYLGTVTTRFWESKQGAEAGTHAICCYLENTGSDPAFLKIDFSDAFCTVSCDEILRAVEQFRTGINAISRRNGQL